MRLLIVLLMAVVALAGADKASFAGRWEMDRERSQHQPADESVVEVIQHDGPKVVITSKLQRPGHDPRSYTVRLTTDGSENLNIVLGREMTARSVWREGELVTHIQDSRGMQFHEVRSLSEDGRTQTVEGFMDTGRRKAMFRRVMVKVTQP